MRGVPKSTAWGGALGWMVLGAMAVGLWGCRPIPEPRVAVPEPAPVEAEEALPESLVAAEPLATLTPTPTPPPPLPFPPGGPQLIRVGLSTDQAEAVFPCCGDRLEVVWDGAVFARGAPLRVLPAAQAASAGVFRLQVAALRDPSQAEELARRLESATGLPADSLIDGATGLYRVRVGRWQTREEADRARALLSPYGVTQAWAVSEGGGVLAPALRVLHPGGEIEVQGRWLAVRTSGDEGIRVGAHRYRGAILLYVNDRGTLNIINEVELEDYIRGVVPRELGPEAYPQLEALKAQAVAARTYALRNFGEFSQEGFDICATPRCQVYGGMDAEHPRSNRAVEETRGQVLLWRGAPIDALYSSTCGGHTEDVGTVFPLKRDQVYLRGVPCVEGQVQRLAGPGARTPFPAAITRALVPPIQGASPPEALAHRLAALAAAGGLPGPTPSLTSLEGREVRRVVAHLFDLALAARLFISADDLPYLLDSPAVEWSEEDRRLAAFFVKSGLGGHPRGDLQEQEQDELLLRLAEYLRVVDRQEMRFHGFEEPGVLVARSDDQEEPRRLVMAPGAATFRRLGEETRPGDLHLLAGDDLVVYSRGSRVIGLIQVVHPEGAAFDRTSPFASWRRFRSDGELAASVRQRYPGFAFSSFEILERGVSGRVGRILLRDSRGGAETVEGLAVRWTLDVPDTLFTAQRLNPPNGQPGWLFAGRGWGHGVGMCQVGAYGMAVRGHDYRRILSHYYTGVELGRILEEP
jgi:stage II sporulation protein D